MKNKLSNSKFKLIALAICMLALLFSVASLNTFASASEYRTFSSTDVSDPLFVKKHFTEIPRAFVAEVNMPSTLATDSPVIVNYPGWADYFFGFEITKNGYPKIYYNSDDNNTKSSISFTSYDARGKGNVTIAVVNEIVDGNAIYKLYVDGVIKETITSKPLVHDFDPLNSQLNVREVSIGVDNKNYNRGSVKSIQVYSKAPSYVEGSGITFEDGTLMASYDNMTESADVIKDTSGNGHDAIRNSVLLNYVDGKTFTASDIADPIVPSEYFTEMPRTFEAEIYMPTGQTISAPVFASYNNNGEGSYVGFEITTSGKPKIYYQDYKNKNDHTTSSITFSNYDVRGKGMVKLAVVNEIVKNESGDDVSVYKLYVNGEIKQTVTSSPYVHNFDIVRAQNVTRDFTLGYDGKNYFQGKIKNVAVYNRAITADEAKASYENGVDLSLDALMAYYDLTNENNTDAFVADETGNGYDLAPAFYERENALKDYAYSFAFVGDTQFLVEQDVKNGNSKYTKPIYDWILQNKDDKKIKYVFGLGDVTQSNKTEEWQYALGLHQELGKELPYAIISGNHDTVSQFDTAFANEPTLTNNISGYYKAGSFGNYYSNFEVCGNKYTVLTLEYTASDAILSWANKVVKAYPDRQFIIITHCYMEYDGNRTEAGGTGGYDNSDGTRNNGEDMWQEFISLHENITMVVAGHIEPMVIQQRHDEAQNGNIVHQFLIDPQGIDRATRYETGMVAMFYFSEDGTEVQVEYISTYKTLENQKNDPEADDVLFREINQFSFEIEPLTLDGVDTPYGLIPSDKADITENPIAVFNNGKFYGGYKYFSIKDPDGDSAMKAAKKLLIGGSYATKGEGTVTILLRDNVTAPNVYENTGQIIGNVVIDLNGYTITQTYENNPLFFTQAKYYKKMGDASFEIKNGNLVITRTLMTMEASGTDYANNATDTSFKTFTMNFSNVNISYKKDANTAAANFLGYFGSNLSNDKKVVYDIDFNDCVFDLTYYNFPSGAAFLNANDTNTSKTNAVVNLDVNGGELILAKSGIVFSSLNASNGSTINFGKTENGNYMAITVPDGVELPVTSVNGGELVFVKVSEANGSTTYRQRPAKVSDINYVPQMSVTLGNAFVMNIYIPVDCTQEFTFGGDTYNSLNNYGGNIVTVNGKDYYLVTASLGSCEAAKDIKVVAKVNTGDVSATATFTFSIPKYAAKVLANATATDVEKTLVKDTLAYIKAAYNYEAFEEFNAEDEIARVNALIESIIGDYIGTPTTSGETNTVAGVTGVTLNLDAKPTIRFYVTDTSIKFYAKGGKLDTVAGTDSNGTYVELDVYAYALCETITYGNGGSYHISSFLAGAAGTSYETLVKCFVKYVESAADYRDSVIGVKN